MKYGAVKLGTGQQRSRSVTLFDLRREPSAKEPDGSSSAKGIRAQSLARKFASRDPGIAADHAVVAQDVEHGYADNKLQRGLSFGSRCVDSGDDQLRDGAKDQTCGQEHPAATPASDHLGILSGCIARVKAIKPLTMVLMMIATTPTATNMTAFSKGLPTPAISKI